MDNLDVPTRIEDEGKSHHHSIIDLLPGHHSGMPVWKEPASDEEVDETHQFDVLKAWYNLFSLPSCQHLMITEQIQKKLHILVGVNVSQEFPWAQIKCKYVRDYLLDFVEHGSAMGIALMGYNPEQHILMGYAPLLTQNKDDIPEGDPFIFFINDEDSKAALFIIQNIERYERWMMNKRLVKRPKRWVSLGSEDEVNLTIQQSFDEPVDVEIQSVYPLKVPASKRFSYRKSTDVRDGYVELLPNESIKFENITRRRITISVQSAPDVVNLEVQTDPTFPTNAWAQYHYEIDEHADNLDLTSEDEETKEEKAKGSKPTTPEPKKPKPPPELSSQIKLLLNTLEFNQIDMYRNDYTAIATRDIEHYSHPYLEETLCFANISKSVSRYVCGIDWYQKLSGLIVTSYTFSTPATVDSASTKEDLVQRAVLQPNPILMWSFADNLNYKLEFESPREITALSFCPHNANLLIGGAKNGQLIIWDLQNRAEKLDVEEILTSAQSRYRILIADFLKWTIQINEEALVPPVITTGLEVSQTAAITGIYWLGAKFYMTSFGKMYTSAVAHSNHKFFFTSSIDGTITFWNLDSLADKKLAGGVKADQPKALTQNESAYKNKVLKPLYTVTFNEPITAVIGDTSLLRSIAREPAKKRKNPLNYAIKTICNDPPEVRQSVITSSFYGRIERLTWLGVYTDIEAREVVTSSANFARVHDGPVIAMRKNPFYPCVFASIGRNVVAVWKDDYNYSPIFWRKRICDLTAVAWSEDRPAVLFLTRIDGNLEAWDILSRDDDASMNKILGGGVVTAISEHRLSEPEKLMGIGDYNSSFRMVKLPADFYIPERQELQRLKDYIHKEESRKRSIQAWEQNYYEKNRDIIEAKRQAEIDARKEMERAQKEEILLEARKQKEEADEKKAAQPLSQLPYPERMQRIWDALNLNRLLSILMSRKRVDAAQLERETKMEKERLAYEASKREALVRTLQNVSEEVARVRSRILPAEKIDLQRSDMIMSLVQELMVGAEDYTIAEDEANEILNELDKFDTLTYINFLQRGEKRRNAINKSLGGNTQRLHWFRGVKENVLAEGNWGYDYYMNAQAELLARQESERSSHEPTENSDNAVNPELSNYSIYRSSAYQS